MALDARFTLEFDVTAAGGAWQVRLPTPWLIPICHLAPAMALDSWFIKGSPCDPSSVSVPQAPEPIDLAVVDGPLITSAAWPGHPAFLAK